jgi:hypothetical protein
MRVCTLPYVYVFALYAYVMHRRQGGIDAPECREGCEVEEL